MESLDLRLWTRIGAMNRYDELLLHMQQKFALGKGRFMGRENLQNLDANRGHEPGRWRFVRAAAQRDRTVL